MAKAKTKAAGPTPADRLKSFVERIEKLEEERAAIGGDVRDVYAEAKGVGYDGKTIRWLISERRINAADRAERDTLRDTYAHALGMAVELVQVEGLSLRQAAKASGVSKSSIQRALAVPALSQPTVEMVEGDLGSFNQLERGETQGPADGPSEPIVPAVAPNAVNATLPPASVSGGSISGQGAEVGNIQDRPAVALDAGLVKRVHEGLKARGDLPPDATLTITEINPGEGAADQQSQGKALAAAPPEKPHEIVREIDPEAMAEAIAAATDAEKPTLYQRITGSFRRGPENVVAIDPKPARKPAPDDDDDLKIPAFLRRTGNAKASTDAG